MKSLRKVKRKLKDKGITIKIKPDTLFEFLFAFFIGKLVLTKNFIQSLYSTGYAFVYVLIGTLVLFGVIVGILFFFYLLGSLLR